MKTYRHKRNEEAPTFQAEVFSPSSQSQRERFIVKKSIKLSDGGNFIHSYLVSPLDGGEPIRVVKGDYIAILPSGSLYRIKPEHFSVYVEVSDDQ